MTTTEIFTVIQETEKAIKVKYPYWEKTTDAVKKHKQKYVEQWVPKAIKVIEQWVKGKMQERGFAMNFITLGIAPEKQEQIIEVEDLDLRKEKFDIFYKKVFELTGKTPHHRSGFMADGAYFEIDGKVYDFEKEYDELMKYRPTKKVKIWK